MSSSDSSLLNQEWFTLQNLYEQYEKPALLIKLTAVVLAFVSIAMSLSLMPIAALLSVLWIQEGVLRTVQSRLGDRLLRIEQLLKHAGPVGSDACQLHSEWLKGRPGILGLLLEYARSAAKPTVAFPYVVLLLIVVLRGVV